MFRACLFLLVVSSFPSWATAALVTLYDGQGFPANQAWLAYRDNSLLTGGTATQAVVAGGIQLQTDAAVSAGYSNYDLLSIKNPQFPTLDRTQGFELSFTAQVLSENHSSNDRAGFSVLLLGADRQGIELGFWQNEIWEQTSNPLFKHGQGIGLDTTLQRTYRLRILGNGYTLSEGANTLLNGSLRDYTAAGFPPYTLPNFLFLGDNTSSAAANLRLGVISLQSNLSAVPEPSSGLLLGVAVSAFGLTTRRRRGLANDPANQCA